jgi:hypothetical protein
MGSGLGGRPYLSRALRRSAAPPLIRANAAKNAKAIVKPVNGSDWLTPSTPRNDRGRLSAASANPEAWRA